MRSKPRGFVLIITNIEFDHMPHRESAKRDEENLVKLFQDMGFEVFSYTNLKTEVNNYYN